MGAIVTVPSEYTLALTFYLLYIVALFIAPLRYAPAILLSVWVLVPIKYLPVPPILATAAGPNIVGIVVVCIRAWAHSQHSGILWVSRRGHRRDVLATPKVLLSALVVWLVISLALSQDKVTSLAWTLSFALLAVGCALVVRAVPASVRPLRATWVTLAAGVGLFAMVEVLLLKTNPVFGSYFAHPPGASRPLTQVWSVYRATTSLGHPLINGLFLAVSVPLCVQALLRRPSFRAVCTFALTLGGLFVTGSRGAMIAAVVGAAAVLLLDHSAPRRTENKRSIRVERALASIGVAVTIVVLASGAYLNGRSETREGQVSTAYRQESLGRAVSLVGTHAIVGVGPGGAFRAAAPQAGAAVGGALENSWLELAVALGVPGFGLVLWLVGHGATRAVRSADGALAGAYCAFFIAASTFNWLEAERGGHLLFGLLLGWAYTGGLTAVGVASPDCWKSPGSVRATA